MIRSISFRSYPVECKPRASGDDPRYNQAYNIIKK